MRVPGLLRLRLTLSVALMFCVPGLAHAEPDPGSRTLAALIAGVAEANQRLEDIGAKVQAEQESVVHALGQRLQNLGFLSPVAAA